MTVICVSQIPRVVVVARVDDLRSDYEALGRLLAEAEGSGAAAIVRERRIVGELLEALETPQEVALVDQLAERRSGSTTSRSSSRRRKSG